MAAFLQQCAEAAVPSMRVRWSEHEAGKPYARPFMVSFVDDQANDIGSIAVNGADLLYWRQFGAAVAALSGELLVLDAVDSARDPQRAWLETLAPLLPSAGGVRVTPRSTFDHERGRVFGFVVESTEARDALVDAPTLLEYQEFQAALAHQTGRLLRIAAVEDIDDAAARRHAWLRHLDGVVARPAEEEAMGPRWPWR